MPRIRRWHPVSHDLNGDAEVWELTERFGDRALRVWLEILSITDRTQGLLKGERKYIESTLAAKCRMAAKTIKGILDYALEKSWMLSDGVLRTRNYGEFHKVREPNKSPQRKPRGSPPSFLPSDPSVLGVSNDTPSSNGLPSASQVQEAYNRILAGQLPRLVFLSDDRKHRIKLRSKKLNELHKWETLFARVSKAPHLLGENDRRWKANLDWLIKNDTNWVKVMEGQYDRQG